MMSIQKNGDPGKRKTMDISFDSIGEEGGHHVVILVLILFISSGFASFALGRLSVETKEGQQSLIIETVPPEFFKVDNVGAETNYRNQGDGIAASENYPFLVGSKNSDKYHFPWCSGAQRIKPENVVVFSSYEEARNAGYTPASNCDGLQ